jgi:hypothetical protein
MSDIPLCSVDGCWLRRTPPNTAVMYESVLISFWTLLRTLLWNLQMWLSIGWSGGLLHSVSKELEFRFHLHTINKPTPSFMMFHEEFLFTWLVKKLPTSFGFSKFITHFTSTCYLILLWTTGIQLTLVCPPLLRF